MVEKEKLIEDRKDERTRQEGSQQSEMINQRKMNLPPIDFNQAGAEDNAMPEGIV